MLNTVPFITQIMHFCLNQLTMSEINDFSILILKKYLRTVQCTVYIPWHYNTIIFRGFSRKIMAETSQGLTNSQGKCNTITVVPSSVAEPIPFLTGSAFFFCRLQLQCKSIGFQLLKQIFNNTPPYSLKIHLRSSCLIRI